MPLQSAARLKCTSACARLDGWRSLVAPGAQETGTTAGNHVRGVPADHRRSFRHKRTNVPDGDCSVAHCCSSTRHEAGSARSGVGLGLPRTNQFCSRESNRRPAQHPCQRNEIVSLSAKTQRILKGKNSSLSATFWSWIVQFFASAQSAVAPITPTGWAEPRIPLGP